MRLAMPLVFGLQVLVALASPLAAEVTRISGTRVSLEPPSDFVAAPRFPGFMKAEAGSSIMVTELSAPVAQVTENMTREGLASRGMVLVTSSKARIANRDALLLHATQEVQGATSEKWMVIFGNAAQTVMIVGTYPRPLAATMSEPIRQAMLSARWNPDQEVDLFEGLPFRVAETESLKFAKRISNMILLTHDGAPAAVSPDSPFAVVGTSISDTDLGDLAGVARHRLEQTAQITGLANLQGKATRIDGLPAYEITADAQDSGSGARLVVYQALIAEGRQYFIVQAMVGSAGAHRFLPQFQEIAASLNRSR